MFLPLRVALQGLSVSEGFRDLPYLSPALDRFPSSLGEFPPLC